MGKKVLGKGLGALLSVHEFGDDGESVVNIPIDSIIPNRLQPRKFFDEEKLEGLAHSVKEKGIIQPIIVSRKSGLKSGLEKDLFEVIVGERRWRACQLLDLEWIPAIIKEASEYEFLELALIENIQRQDLNAIEEAISYKELLENLNLTQEKLSIKIGKSRTAIANTLRLLKLPSEVQAEICQARLTEGHGRALLSLKNEVYLRQVKDKVIALQLSVRETEKVIQEINEGVLDFLSLTKKEPKSIKIKKDIKKEVVELEMLRVQKIEEKLHSFLKIPVRIKRYLGSNQGKIEIKYKDQEELRKILSTLGVKEADGL